MVVAICVLVFFTLLGLAAAAYNLQDDAGRQYRLEQRRKQRATRKKGTKNDK